MIFENILMLTVNTTTSSFNLGGREEVYYIGVPIEKKNTLREEVYYIGVPIEKNTILLFQ